jgi:hypothetical protein
MGEEEKKDRSFVVKDKRIFSESGDDHEKGQKRPTGQESNACEHIEAKGSEPEADYSKKQEQQYLPEVNFFNFVVSLSTTAMFHFGDFPDPITNKAEKNLPAAKQMIDTLSMLKTKTEGNLDENEKALLENILFELKMRYVKEMG